MHARGLLRSLAAGVSGRRPIECFKNSWLGVVISGAGCPPLCFTGRYLAESSSTMPDGHAPSRRERRVCKLVKP